jgi:PAS domain S-box-containing protein
LNTVFPLILGDVGRPITDIAQSFVGPIVFENAKEVIRTGEAQERELRTPDNRWYMMRVLPYQPEPGHAEGAVMTFVDVTGLKNAQEAARDAKLYSESIVEAARAPLVVLDAALRVRSANPSFYQLFELAPELTLGRPFFEIGKREWDILPLRESLTQVITKDAVISDFHVDADFERVGKRNLILNIRKLHVAGEAALLVTMEDITDRKRVEESLIRQARLARSNAAWEQFAYAASHDLREPLRMITSYTELLQQRLGDRLDQETRRFMTFVIEGANRMGTLITALLDFSRAGAEDSPSTVVDCNDSLREAISNLSEEIRQTGAVITHDPLPRVSVHPAPMLVILQNLLQNAVKYHAEDRNPEVHVSARQTENEWIFSVRDNGIGIDPHDFKRIFGLFKRLHGDMYPGTGIGLAVCQRLIERYGGGIWVESEVGRGSTFRFSLPLES